MAITKSDREEMILTHLPYELDQYFATDEKVRRDERERALWSELLCLHARNLVEFFTRTSSINSNDAASFHFADRSYTKTTRKTGSIHDLNKKINVFVSHLDYGRADRTRVSGPDIDQCREFILNEVARLQTHLAPEYSLDWTPPARPVALLDNLPSTTAIGEVRVIPILDASKDA